MEERLPKKVLDLASPGKGQKRTFSAEALQYNENIEISNFAILWDFNFYQWRGVLCGISIELVFSTYEKGSVNRVCLQRTPQ